ncbi:MAG TPA: HAMP domain-containing sensor histidine kinase [Puia sp.]|nr:HAMP domain-containing sensor histidine kinase [Puia sp.]
MKLLSKITLYTTLSKTVIVLLFILLLPGIVKDVTSQYTNYILKEQKKKVLDNIQKKGIDYYFEGDSSYGSYTLLKEEFIALETVRDHSPADSIFTDSRIVENDTLTYRLLDYTFEYKNKNYLLEIGKTVSAIDQYNRPLQKVALYTLAGLIFFTLILDLMFTRLLLRPLNLIITSKILNRKFPFKETILPVKTSTTDFKFLDQSLIDLASKIKETFEKEKEFTSNASHELMTPISILQNKMENVMMDQELTEMSREKVVGMLSILNRLKKIVRSLLLISRIENDQYVKTDEIKPYFLVEEVLNELKDRIELRKIRIVQSLSQYIVLTHLNRDLIFQLIYNLINNAIRYNHDEGEIEITDQIINNESYVIHIKDTGVGIRAHELETIFDRFKKAVNESGEGYGLGLSIVKSIAQYHDIRITVQSEYGKGSTFSIHFPKLLTFAGT